MKITVIFTGGTIGSIVGSDGYISPDRGQPYKLLKDCEGIEFHTREPYRILSEHLDGEHLNLLADVVRQEMKDQENAGIIITHGTDTLQYSAAVLSYLIGTDTIPVVLVSSDYPLEDERANGLVNFACAVDFIQQGYGRGVFVSYCNKGQNPAIHRGTRLFAHQSYSADLYSIDQNFYGEYVNGQFVINERYSAGKTGYSRLGELGQKPEELCMNTETRVLWIQPYVGITYPALKENIGAVLLDSYHSGTIGIHRELVDFLEEAQEKHIPVWLTGFPGEEHAYETIREYERLGIRVLPKMSAISAYCKLWLAAGNGMDIEKVMTSCIAEDFI